MLNWKPNYNHSRVKSPSPSILTVQTAYDSYEKLVNYWAVEEYQQCPAAGWPMNSPNFHRHLFYPNGFHHAVRWMPKLKNGWRRMSYLEFCNWYGLSED